MDKTYKKTKIIRRALYYSLHQGRVRMGDKLKYNQIILPDSFPNLCNQKYIGRRGSTNTFYIYDREVEDIFIKVTKILTGNTFDPEQEKQYRAFFYYVVQTEEQLIELRLTQSDTCRLLTGYWFDVYISSDKDVSFINNSYLSTKIIW